MLKMISILLFVVVKVKQVSASEEKKCQCATIDQIDCMRRQDCKWNFKNYKCSDLYIDDVHLVVVLLEIINVKYFQLVLHKLGVLKKNANDLIINAIIHLQEVRPSDLVGSVGYCKYDSKTFQCQRKYCEDIKSNSEDGCRYALSDYYCTTDNITCVTAMTNTCSDYSENTCPKAQLLEGPGQFVDGKCRVRDCSTATSSYKSADQCPSYHSSCKFNGVECVSAYSSCSIYSVQDCELYIGISGRCLRNQQKDACQDQTFNRYQQPTDQLCIQSTGYTLKCISDGVRCVSYLPCDLFKTKETCFNSYGVFQKQIMKNIQFLLVFRVYFIWFLVVIIIFIVLVIYVRGIMNS